MTDVLLGNLVHFVRYLRMRQLPVVPATAREMAEAFQIIGLDRRDDVYHAAASLAVSHPSHREAFDDAFELFFGSGLALPIPVPMDRALEATASAREGRTATASAPVLGDRLSTEGDAEDVSNVIGGSYQERLAQRDFRELSSDEKEEVRRLIARMMWRPAEHQSRRWRPSGRGVRPDLRRTFRNMTRPEGDLLPLAMAARRMRRRPLVIIADVSGSMERYTEMFLHFIHAAHGRLGRVEAFVFATRLSRITRQMRQRLPHVALSQTSHAVEDWSGGTRIGEALHEFNRQWSRRVTRGGAIALVISDGWDTGDVDLLRGEMALLARSVHRVVWLSPLAGRPGFSPETKGLVTVLPYVDDFLAAANVLDLREVVRLLESIPARRRS